MAGKILIIGGGGREHALAWKLKQSPKVEKIFVAPGNAGTAQTAENINITALDIFGLADFAEKNQIDFTVVGPDDSLALGVVDEFKKRGLKIWGASKAAAEIESNKAFAKELMKENNIPTADYQTFTDYNQAWEYTQKQFDVSSRPTTSAADLFDATQGRLELSRMGEKERRDPLSSDDAQSRDSSTRVHSLGMTQAIVIKASGLALGKGVAVCNTMDDAENFLRDCMVNKIFGQAGTTVVIEQFLQGQEFSAHALSDGENFIMFPPSQDHKRVSDGDQGPNTGGMGTIAPLPWVTEELMDKVSSQIVKPALEGLKNLGSPFAGLLYPGLMMTSNGPSVIEFNSRFGDPECQSYMRLLKSDLYDVLLASAEGSLAEIKLEWNSGYTCCIIIASKGYPGKYEKGFEIRGIEQAEQLNDVIIFHSGTKLENGKLLTNGGRVLGVTATGDDLKSALEKAYAAIRLIHFEGMHYRTDIGVKSLNANP